MLSSEDERQPLILSGVTHRQKAFIRPSAQRKIACIAILVAEAFERLACYSVTGNLVFFLSKQPLCWNNYMAATAVLVFTAIMYITGLFGGWISDSYLGRYTTIIVGYVIYGIGYVYLPILTYSSQDSFKPQLSGLREGTPCNSTWKSDHVPLFCSSEAGGAFNCTVPIFLSLILIGIGAGVVRTNLAPFGGDQVR